MVKNKFKRILALFLVAIVTFNIVLIGGSAEEAVILTENSNTDSSNIGNPKFDILHMDRTIKLSDETDTYAENCGFDVTLTAYMDEFAAASTPLDIIFVIDNSNSMGREDRKQVSNSVKEIINTTKAINPDTRFGMVAFGHGLNADGSVYDLVPASQINLNNSSDAFVEAFDDYISTPSDGTHIWKGYDKAYEIFNTHNTKGYQRVCVLLTDGLPTDNETYWFYSDDAANSTLTSASKLKTIGVDMFSVKAFYDWPSSNEEKEIAERLCHYVSSAYGAEVIDIHSTYTPVLNNSSYYVKDANSSSELIKIFTQLSASSKIYPFILNNTGILQDVVTPYFDISNAQYEIQTPVFESTTTNDKTTWQITSWNTESTGDAVVDGQRVYMSGFNYTERCVSPANDTRAARVVLTYHIDPMENFFGGNGIPTNIEGSTSDNNYLTGGSGIYCNGDFLKAFEEQAVCIRTRGQEATIVPETIVSYKTVVDPNELIETPDLTETFINGTNNAFADIRVGVYIYNDNSNEYSDYVVLAYINKGNLLNEAQTQSLQELSVTSHNGVKYTIEYQVIPDDSKRHSSDAMYNCGSFEDANSGFVISLNSGIIRTNTLFNATFTYIDTPDEITENIAEPSDIIGKPREEIEEFVANQINPTLGSTTKDFNVEDYDMSFTGWTINSEIENDDGTITINYIGKWVGGGYFFVNVYTPEWDNSYSNEPSYKFEKEVPLTSTVNTVTAPEYNNFPIVNGWSFASDHYLYYKNDNGKNVLNREDIINNYDYFSAGINQYIGYTVRYNDIDTGDDKYLTGTKGEPLFTLVNTHFCNTCGSVVTADGTTRNDENGNLLYDCPYCQKETLTINYSDFELDESLSTTDITITSNLSQNVINLYFKRCEHKTTLTINNLDDNTKKSFTSTTYYDTSHAPELSNSTNSDYSEEFKDFAFYNYDEWIYATYTPFTTTKVVGTTGFIPTIEIEGNAEETSFVNNENFQSWFENEWVELWYGAASDAYYNLIMDTVEFGSLALNTGYCWPAYDISYEITIESDKYDLELEKLWSDNVSEKDKQSCVFALYEVNKDDSYTLATRFAVNPNETNIVLSGLNAGRKYVIEEESWSYKTNSNCFRNGSNEIKFVGANISQSENDPKYYYSEGYLIEFEKNNNLYYLGNENPVLRTACTNNVNHNWTGGMTVDKGLINRYNGTSVVCIPIVKTKKEVI